MGSSLKQMAMGYVLSEKTEAMCYGLYDKS